MNKKAIIVIDLQNCFINRKNRHLVNKIKKHVHKKQYDFIIFSKFVNSEKSNFFRKLGWKKCMKPPETDIVKELREIPCHIFERPCYSVFKSNDLTRFIREKGIKKIYLCGLDIDACLLASAFDAFDMGLDYEIIKELSGSSSGKKMDESARRIIKRNL